MSVKITNENKEIKKATSNELKQRVAAYKKDIELEILEQLITKTENSQFNIQQVADRNPFSE